MFILRIEYRLVGDKKSKVEYRDFNELTEATEMREKWIRVFKPGCDTFDAVIFEATNY
jgi:hypothetical protein